MNINAMLKDLWKEKRRIERDAESMDTHGDNRYSKALAMGFNLAYAIVRLHCLNSSVQRWDGKPYPSLSDKIAQKVMRKLR